MFEDDGGQFVGRDGTKVDFDIFVQGFRLGLLDFFLGLDGVFVRFGVHLDAFFERIQLFRAELGEVGIVVDAGLVKNIDTATFVFEPLFVVREAFRDFLGFLVATFHVHREGITHLARNFTTKDLVGPCKDGAEFQKIPTLHGHFHNLQPLL